MTEIGGDYSAYIKSQVKFLKDDLEKVQRAYRPFVTISRETGAYGITIAKSLCDYLQKNESSKKCPWTVFDKELLKKVVEDYDLPETVLPYLSESTISEIEDMMEEAVGLHPSRHLLVLETRKTILHLAQLGYAILVGRGSNIIAAEVPGGVHIRLIASLEKRIDHIQEFLKITKKEAKEFVIKEDRNRSNYVKKYLDKNIADPLLYDLIINVDNLGPQEAVRVIGNLVLKQF